MWYFLLCCGGILLRPYLFTPSMISLRYSASLWWYPSLPLSLHARRGIVAVFGFAVALSFFALISSHPAWYCCGIRLRGGDILLRPYLFTPGVVLLRYLASLWWYRCGIQLRCGGILLRPYFLLVLTGGSRSTGSRR